MICVHGPCCHSTRLKRSALPAFSRHTNETHRKVFLVASPKCLPAVFPSRTWSAEMGISHRNLKGSNSAELWAGREFEGCKVREHQEGVKVLYAVNRATLIYMQDSCGCLRCTQTRWSHVSQASQDRGWARVGVYGTRGTKMAALPSRRLQFLLVSVAKLQLRALEFFFGS